MDCREKILSEDYLDIITDYPVRRGEAERYDLCYTNLEKLYHILYLNRNEVPDLNQCH